MLTHSTGEEEQRRWGYDQCIPKDDSPWTQAADGLYFRGRDSKPPEKVIHQHIWIRERIWDIDGKNESVALCWFDMDTMRSIAVPRTTISSSARILSLADNGLAVTSRNAGLLVRYLEHLFDYHQERIPTSFVVSTCGTKLVSGERVFMLGHHPICASTEAPSVSFNPQADSTEVLRAYRKSGTLDAWLGVARKMNTYPTAAFGIAAGFLPPLLTDLGMMQNPIIDYSGRTSCGKSTILRFIASVWGYPLEAGGGLIRTWDATPVYMERLSSLANELPIFMDESHTAKPEDVQRAIYQYSNGTGRGRGRTNGGVQSSAHYRGVMFSAGERRLTDAGGYGGVQARIIGFHGSPFGANQGELVQKVNQVAIAHYGHAGEAVLREYMRHRDVWMLLILEAKEKALARLLPRCRGAVSERLAGMFAAVEAAGTFANGVFDLGWDVSAVVDAAFASLKLDQIEDDARTSIKALGAWLSQMGSAGRILHDGESIHPDHVGRYIRIGGDNLVAMLPEALEDFLRSHGYDYDRTLTQWHRHGWLETDKDRKTKKVRFGDNPTNMLVLSTTGMVAAGLGEDVDQAEHLAG